MNNPRYIKALSLAVLLFGMYSTDSGQRPTDVSINGMIGKVKRVDVRRATMVLKKGVQKEERAETEKSLFFDTNGRLTSKSISGYGVSETRYSYEKNGVRKAITDRTEPFDKPGKIKIPGYSASKFTFDEKERSILEETFGGGPQTGPVLELQWRSHSYKFYFDETDRLIKEEFLSPDGKELTTYTYFYRDATHNPTDVVISSKRQVLQFIKFTYELDKNGNWTKRREVKRPIDPKNPTITEVNYRKISYYKD